MATKINTYYSKIGKKKEFFTKILDKKEVTDQTQLAGASIKELAKKFGIDALKSKAKQMTIENQELLDKLYGHDYTNMFKSKEDLLNTKKNLNNAFEKIPAQLRKVLFKDDVTEFVHAMTTNDEIKLKELNKYGIISDTQLNSVIEHNNAIKEQRRKAETQQNFINELEKMKGKLYENFEKTGIINLDNSQNDTTSTKDI